MSKTLDNRRDDAGFAEARGARRDAEQTPSSVLAGMLAGPRQVTTAAGTLTVHPLNLDILWVLQAAKHPLGAPSASGVSDLTPLQIAQVIFAFCAPAQALDAAASPAEPESALSTFDRASLAYLRAHVPLPSQGAVVALIVSMVTEGLATAPGGGNPPSPATA